METDRLEKLKQLLIEDLLCEYTYVESKEQVENSTITEENGFVTIVYRNGIIGRYKSIMVEKLEHLGHENPKQKQ